MRLIRPWLSVGGYRDTANPMLLKGEGIGAMLQLAEKVEQPDIPTLYLRFEDGFPIPDGVLDRSLEFVLKSRLDNRHVLIACGAGISRSVTVAIAALRETEGLGLEEAFRDIKLKHPGALPHPALWASLCAHYQVDIPYRRLLKSLG